MIDKASPVLKIIYEQFLVTVFFCISEFFNTPLEVAYCFMAYVALYRKWRPEKFSDLVGQEHISRTLANAISSGRIGHAYLFSGPRGTGKTSTAKIFARALNCEHGPTPEPCGECEACRKIAEGSSLDVFEIDAASNRGIDEIRDLRETVKFAAVDGRYKVYIIDEVHMLTTEAFNALLKTLEEPPGHVVFILATTEAHKVPATIQSRCQRYDFRRIGLQEIGERLRKVADQMGLQAEPEALSLIALQADGGLRDALSLLDQCASLAEGSITAERVRKIMGLIGHDYIYKLTENMADRQAQKALEILAELLRDGKDLKQILIELVLHLRGLMIYQATGNLGQLDLYDEQEQELERQSRFFTAEQLMKMVGRIHEAMTEMKWSPQPRITVEVALLELCREPVTEKQQMAYEPAPGKSVPDEMSKNRLAQLEAKLEKLASQVAKSAALGVRDRGKAPGGRAGKTVVKPRLLGRESALRVPEMSQETRQKGQELLRKLINYFAQGEHGNIHSWLKAGQFAYLGKSEFRISLPDIQAKRFPESTLAMIQEALQELAQEELRFSVVVREDKPEEAPPSEEYPEPPEEAEYPEINEEDQRELEEHMKKLGGVGFVEVIKTSEEE